MALESASYISGLVSANPPASDPVAQADDHIRLIKSVLKTTFPNIDAAVTSTPKQLNLGPVPTGGIILWYGTVATIPSGYALCDGGTYAKSDGSGNIVAPDLTDRFVVGAGDTYTPGDTGGSVSKTTAAGGGFTPSGTLSSAGAHSHGGSTGSHVLTEAEIPAHVHTIGLGAYQASVGTGFNSAYQWYGTVTPTQVNTSSVGGGSGHSHTISEEAAHTHTFTGDAQADHTHGIADALPPYYALAYIMKL